MVLFRGITTEGKVVEGSLVQFNGHNYIVTDKNGYSYSRITASHGYLSTDDALEVPPSSLAMSTGISDKNKVPIYGSFEVDGVMSEGGDDVWLSGEDEVYVVVWGHCGFDIQSRNKQRTLENVNPDCIEVIPKQEQGENE